MSSEDRTAFVAGLIKDLTQPARSILPARFKLVSGKTVKLSEVEFRDALKKHNTTFMEVRKSLWDESHGHFILVDACALTAHYYILEV